MSGSPTFDTGKNRNGANLKLRHTLRAGGVKKEKHRKIERGEFITLPRPTGRRSNYAKKMSLD